MNFRHILAAMLLSVFTMGAAYAAGQPLHEDYTELLKVADTLLAAAKAKDEPAFSNAISEGRAIAKDQGNKGNSPRLQRVSTAFIKAKKAAKSGNFDEAGKLIEDAKAEMEKPDVAPTFGGTTEGGGRKGMFGEY